MLIAIPALLNPEQLAEVRAIVDAGDWFDGNATSGAQAAEPHPHTSAPRCLVRRQICPEVVDVSSNSFTEPVPTGICHGKELAKLSMLNNGFTGRIPARLALCASLVHVQLHSNRLQRLDSRLVTPTILSDEELTDLVAFVRNGLLDPSAESQRLRRLIPERLASGRTPLRFEFSR